MLLTFSDNTSEELSKKQYYEHIKSIEVGKRMSSNPSYDVTKIKNVHTEQWDIFGLKSTLIKKGVKQNQKGKCSCSHDIVHEFYTKNKINKTVLRVGSVCVKKTTGEYYDWIIDALYSALHKDRKLYKKNLNKFDGNENFALKVTIRELKLTAKCELCKTRIDDRYKRCYQCFTKLDECSTIDCKNKVRGNYTTCYHCHISKYSVPLGDSQRIVFDNKIPWTKNKIEK